MRKNNWVSLAIALAVAALIAGLEQRRGRYFLEPQKSANVFDALFHKKELSFARDPAFLARPAGWALYAWRLKILGGCQPHPDVFIIAVDESSPRCRHQWPCPRGLRADLSKKLSVAPPKALFFDMRC